jgi:hypothetical protein
MKYDKDKLDTHIKMLSEMCIYVGDDIVYEGQCGQLDHFDKLPKAEQIALIDIFAKMKAVKEALVSYGHWFNN